MKRRDASLSIALCASLTVHVFLLRGMAERYVRSIGRVFLAADQPLPPDENHASLLMLPAPVEPHELLGEESVQPGSAVNSSAGETELHATKVSPTPQPLLGRDPPGENGKVAPSHKPSEQTSQSTESIPKQPPPPPPSPEKSDSVEKPLAQSKVEDAPHAGSLPSTQATAQADHPKQQQPVQVASVMPAKPQAASADEPRKAAPSAAPGNPMPQGASDSDPFTVVGSAEFSPGAMNAQIGRPHRITRPRIDLAGLVDAAPMNRIQLALELTIDRTGNVVNAEIAEPSGSFNIDQATRLAAFNWWFKPRLVKDQSGAEVPIESESFRFIVAFR